MIVDPCIIVKFTQEIQQAATVYQNFISYLYEAQHVSGDTAHHQEPKNALAVSGFPYVEGCWPLANNPPRMENQKLLVQF